MFPKSRRDSVGGGGVLETHGNYVRLKIGRSVLPTQFVVAMLWSLAMHASKKRPASDGGLCGGHLLMMSSAVCSGSPHSHAPLSVSPHFFMDDLYPADLYRPTHPVRSLFRVVQRFFSNSKPLQSSIELCVQ